LIICKLGWPFFFCTKGFKEQQFSYLSAPLMVFHVFWHTTQCQVTHRHGVIRE